MNNGIDTSILEDKDCKICNCPVPKAVLAKDIRYKSMWYQCWFCLTTCWSKPTVSNFYGQILLLPTCFSYITLPKELKNL